MVTLTRTKDDYMKIQTFLYDYDFLLLAGW